MLEIDKKSFPKNIMEMEVLYYSLSEAEDKDIHFEHGNTIEHNGKTGFVIGEYVAFPNLKKTAKDTIFCASLPNKANIINTMNLFSAADLSQCSYEIAVDSNIPLKSFKLDFDIPIEFLPSHITPSITDAYYLSYRDSTSLEAIRNHINLFHVKMPTMNNLQMLRSLVLTTIITALFSITLTNFYYAMRKKFIKQWKKRRLNYSQAKRYIKVWL